tara:strand:+ start:5356 stop:6201 length:846 start_codon:yes stop_codon:yes gene_type:complete
MINIQKNLRSNLANSIFIISIFLIGVLSACSDNDVINEDQRSINETPNSFSFSELDNISNFSSEVSNQITVNGNAIIEVEPDIAMINLSIESRESTVVNARENNTSVMLKVLKKLYETGIDESSINTNFFSITPITQWNTVRDDTGEYSEQIILGYNVVNSITIELEDIDRVGEIIDIVTLAGGNLIRVGSIGFNVKNTELYSEQLRILAVENSLNKAKSYAKAARVELGSLISLQEISSPSINAMESSNFERMMVDFVTPINPEGKQLSVNIIATYEIKD